MGEKRDRSKRFQNVHIRIRISLGFTTLSTDCLLSDRFTTSEISLFILPPLPIKINIFPSEISFYIYIYYWNNEFVFLNKGGRLVNFSLRSALT